MENGEKGWPGYPMSSERRVGRKLDLQSSFSGGVLDRAAMAQREKDPSHPHCPVAGPAGMTERGRLWQESRSDLSCPCKVTESASALGWASLPRCGFSMARQEREGPFCCFLSPGAFFPAADLFEDSFVFTIKGRSISSNRLVTNSAHAGHRGPGTIQLGKLRPGVGERLALVPGAGAELGLQPGSATLPFRTLRNLGDQQRKRSWQRQ